jgi:hypothetical protein
MLDKQRAMMELVNIVFKKLSLRYGRDFLVRWEGLDLADVKSDWAHELDGFESAPHAIHYALQNLPDSKPPNVAEFRAIARSAPSPVALRIEAPRANPEIVRAELLKAKAALTRGFN